MQVGSNKEQEAGTGTIKANGNTNKSVYLTWHSIVWKELVLLNCSRIDTWIPNAGNWSISRLNSRYEQLPLSVRS